MIPRAKGVSDHVENLQLLCGARNRAKGAGSQAELLAKLRKRGQLAPEISRVRSSLGRRVAAANKGATAPPYPVAGRDEPEPAAQRGEDGLMTDRARNGKGVVLAMAAVTGAVMATVLLAAPNGQEHDPVLVSPERLRDAVRTLTHATGTHAAFGMHCVDEQRRVRVPCAPDGLQIRRFPDGSMVLTLLSPGYDPRRASGRHLYIPPDPRIADLEETLAVLRADHQELTKRLEALENGR